MAMAAMARTRVDLSMEGMLLVNILFDDPAAGWPGVLKLLKVLNADLMLLLMMKQTLLSQMG
jgi:hypothetical protein